MRKKIKVNQFRVFFTFVQKYQERKREKVRGATKTGSVHSCENKASIASLDVLKR
jgi:hypothetical protein